MENKNWTLNSLNSIETVFDIMVKKNILTIIIISGIIISIPIIFLVLSTNKNNSSSSNGGDSDGSGTIALSAPGGLNTSAIYSMEVELFWSDNSNNENGFIIERSTSETGTFTQIDSVPANSIFYIDTNLDNNETYFYRVKSYNNAGTSGSSKIANSTTNEKPDKFGIQEGHYSFHGAPVAGPPYYYPVTGIDDAYRMFDNLDDLAIKNFRYTIFYMIDDSIYPKNWTHHELLIQYLYDKGLNISIMLQGYEDFPPFNETYGLNEWLYFVGNITERYGHMVNTYEIWNEPDLLEEGVGKFWGPVPSPKNFTILVNETAKKIRSIQPGAKIIMGGVTSLPSHRQFLIDCFEYYILESVDAVGIHPYRHKPEDAFDIDYYGNPTADNFTDQINNLTTLILGYKSGIELWSTECGYINDTTTEDNYISQAKFLSRTILLEHAVDLKGITHFRLRSPPEGPDWDPIFLGMVDKDTFERYQAFRAFESISKCFGSSSVEYVKTLYNQGPGFNITMQIYSKNGSPIIAYWYPEDIDNEVKQFDNVDVRVDDITGNEFRFKDILSEDPSEKVLSAQMGSDVQFSDLPISDYPYILFME